MKILNYIACDLKSMQIEFRFNSYYQIELNLNILNGI